MTKTSQGQDMPKAAAIEPKPPTQSSAIATYEAFLRAVQNAQFERKEYLEVTPDLFRQLTDGLPTPYLTFGKPGVKVFIEGTRKEILAHEKLNVEDWRNEEIARAKRENRKPNV